MSKPNLMVIGGTGFIGHHLVKSAIEKNWGVSSLSLNRPSADRKIKGVEYYYNNLENRLEFKKLLSKKYDYVVNLSGYINHTNFFGQGHQVISEHFDFVREMVILLNKENLKCFINIGSSDEYGDNFSPQSETQRENPISPYSLGKTASTHFLEMIYKTEGFPCCTLRLFLVYGPGQNQDRFIPQIIKGCIKDENFNTSFGKQLRDFCYIDDVIDGIFNVLSSKKVFGKTYNLASGKPISIKSIINKIINITRKGKPNYGAIPYREGENMSLYADITKIRNELNWLPKTSIDEGLNKTVNWYLEKWSNL